MDKNVDSSNAPDFMDIALALTPHSVKYQEMKLIIYRSTNTLVDDAVCEQIIHFCKKYLGEQL
jgi:hypothetical protein